MDALRLYRQHGPAIYARCRRLLGDDDAAAAATHRAFVRAVERLPGDRRETLRALRRSADEVCLAAGRLVSLPADDHREAFLVELSLAGGLTRVEEAELEAHLPGCARCRRALDETRRARERFAREVFARTRPFVERDARAPLVLRWVWIFGPILVAAAMAGMFFAARSARPGDPRTTPAFAVYREASGERLATGSKIGRGERLRVVLSPAGQPWAAVYLNARVHARVGPIPYGTDRVPVEPPLVVGEAGEQRVSATFGASPRGTPAAEVGIVVEVE